MAIAKDESYFGEVTILGKPYIAGYEPVPRAETYNVMRRLLSSGFIRKM